MIAGLWVLICTTVVHLWRTASNWMETRINRIRSGNPGSEERSQTEDFPSLPISNSQSSHSALQNIQSIPLFAYELADEITQGSPETMQQIIQDILNDKILPTKNPELWKYVQGCLRNNVQLLQLCKASTECLMKVQDNCFVLQQLGIEDKMVHSAILEEKLENFKAAVNPSLDDFLQHLSTSKENQRLTLKNLERRRDLLDNKLESLKFWREVLRVISFVTLIISLALLFLVPPNVVTAVVTLLSGHFGGPVHKWLDSFWIEYENALEAERKLIRSMIRTTYDSSADLDEIKVAVNSLSKEILQILTQNVHHTTTSKNGGEAVLKILLEKIEKTSGVCSNVSEKSERCTLRVETASTAVLKKVNEFAQKR